MNQVRLIAALVTILIGSLTACNTLEGAGEDIQDAGEAIEDRAEKHD
ncbi:entericidin A/B family lipoprotein [Candidatus Nitronereus thalassa]|uniref:Entericidin A/B family lipoprotein n=1 Tax=Candidatus Nitronereus thalassa TaxID=3020898 RepID=A0ABU3KB99_9BACT|nr:entericidin A/B family lipoprotein [Candidatus Nitronereus thalassa]MDT7043769.1 entericidin A/B family lipoprotein [Candidatus Nitronereus thalassa]